MKYIVKNCPCLFNSYYASGKTVRFECNDGNHDNKLCRDCTDCLIKRVIDKCNHYQNKIGRTVEYRAGYVDATKQILDMFDIEEIKE